MMPQSHGPGGQVPPMENMVCSVCGSRLICTPACAAAVWKACTSVSVVCSPVEYISLSASCLPAEIPAPHWLGPVPGLWQLMMPPPPGAQPWLVSSDLAASIEYGSGSTFSCGLTYGDPGRFGTGP